MQAKRTVDSSAAAAAVTKPFALVTVDDLAAAEDCGEDSAALGRELRYYCHRVRHWEVPARHEKL